MGSAALLCEMTCACGAATFTPPALGHLPLPQRQGAGALAGVPGLPGPGRRAALPAAPGRPRVCEPEGGSVPVRRLPGRAAGGPRGCCGSRRAVRDTHVTPCPVAAAGALWSMRRTSGCRSSGCGGTPRRAPSSEVRPARLLTVAGSFSFSSLLLLVPAPRSPFPLPCQPSVHRLELIAPRQLANCR